MENSFKPGEKFERIIYEDKPAQYSYKDGKDYVFMDLATYDQLTLSPEVLEEATKYLVEDMEIQLEVFEGKISTFLLSKLLISSKISKEELKIAQGIKSFTL